MTFTRACLAVLACSIALFAQSADEEIGAGDRLAAEGKWDDAAEHYRKALDADPNSVKARGLLGCALIRGEKSAGEGMRELEKVAKMRSAAREVFEPIKVLGHELLEEGDSSLNVAMTVLWTAYMIDEADDQVARELGIAHSRHDHPTDAIAYWKKSLERNPDQPEVRQLLADEEQKEAERRAPPRSAAEASQFPSIGIKSSAGWALLPDGSTLVVALPDSAELLYVDTEAGKELKRVSLEFKPGAMVLQGSMLYVAAQGASFVYAIDPASGEQKKEIKVAGDPIVDLAGAPGKSVLWATNAHEDVVAIDPKAGTANKTAGKGHYLAVDPAGAFVYTARTNPNKWDVVVEKGQDGSETYYWDDWGYRAILVKYAVNGKSLKQVGVNNNAAVNGQALCLSPDGKRISVVGGGGWRPKAGGSGAGGYVVAFFDTGDMTTMRGQVDTDAYPENAALHPVLPIGVALKSEAHLIFFNAKSLAATKTVEIKKAPRAPNQAGKLIFAGRGTRLVYLAVADTFRKEDGRLYFVPLDLNDEDRKALAKAYGAGGGPANDLKKLFDEAQAAEKAGDKAKAIKLYRQVVKADPSGDLGNQAARKVLELEDE
ncbi:MAG: tetratricopeptide repeat protein [Planctomycetota bacterium]